MFQFNNKSENIKIDEQKSIIRIRRDEYRADIRKQQNESRFRQKRIIYNNALQNNVSNLNLDEAITNIPQINDDMDDIQFTTKILKLFELTSQQEASRFKILLDQNWISIFNKILKDSKNQLNLEYCFGILANLSNINEYINFNQNFIQFSISKGAEILLQFKNYNVKLINNVLIYISNICDKNQSLSNIFLEQNILLTLNKLGQEYLLQKYCLDNIYYTLNTIILNASQIQESHVLQAIDIIAFGLQVQNDDLIEYDMMVLLTTIKISSINIVHKLIELNLLKFLLKQLKQQENFVSSLKVIKDISVIEDVEPIFLLIQDGILDDLNIFLTSSSQTVRKLVYLIMVNMTYTNQKIVEIIMNHSIFNRLINILMLEKQDECTYVLGSFLNILSLANFSQYHKLIEKELLVILRRFLELPEAQILLHSIEALRFFCNFGREIQEQNILQQNPIVSRLKIDNIVIYLDRLQNHQSQAVYLAAQKLLCDYFDYE